MLALSNCEPINMSEPTSTIGMNVQAVLQMQVSRNEEALNYLYGGLKTLVSRFFENGRPYMEPHCCCPSDPLRYMLRENDITDKEGKTRSDRRLLVSVPLPEDDTSSDSNTYDDVYILFNRALHLSPEAADMVGRADFYDHLMAAVFFYNIGLAYHLNGLRSGDSKLLQKALDFYLTAYGKMTDQSMHLRGRIDLLNLAFMALVNNIGHVHAHFRCLRSVSLCTADLCQRLAYIVPSTAICESVLSDGEYKVFFLNICFFQEAELFASPAA